MLVVLFKSLPYSVPYNTGSDKPLMILTPVTSSSKRVSSKRDDKFFLAILTNLNEVLFKIALVDVISISLLLRTSNTCSAVLLPKDWYGVFLNNSNIVGIFYFIIQFLNYKNFWYFGQLLSKLH